VYLVDHVVSKSLLAIEKVFIDVIEATQKIENGRTWSEKLPTREK